MEERSKGGRPNEPNELRSRKENLRALTGRGRVDRGKGASRLTRGVKKSREKNSQSSSPRGGRKNSLEVGGAKYLRRKKERPHLDGTLPVPRQSPLKTKTGSGISQ